MILRVISWAVWSFGVLLIFSSLLILTTNELKSEPFLESSTAFGVTALLIALAIFEGWLTIFIRKMALIKPAMAGKFSVYSNTGRLRLLMINVVNWFIIVTIAIYGEILYSISNQSIYLFASVVISFGLICLHSPRETPYMKNAC